MALPASLVKFDAATLESSLRPKRFYDVILSRPRHTTEIAPGIYGTWSQVIGHRCFLTREGLNDRMNSGFLVCILREFDEYPG